MNKKVILGACALVFSQMASAASFDFTGLGTVPTGGYSATSDGITVTVTAPGEDLWNYNLDGLGVSTGFFNLGGLQNNETLLVSFSEEVTLGSLDMRQWEGPDAVLFNSAGGNLNFNTESCGFCTTETFDLTSLTGLTSFTLTGDSFLTVTFLSALNDVQVTAVPVPAAAWLFMSALGGLTGVRRLQKNKA
jgi:hypothetical protein